MRRTVEKNLTSRDRTPYELIYPWPEDCLIHCSDGSRPFFECYPRNPQTYMRVEGNTIEEAETKAWNRLVRYILCKEHEFEARGYSNGAGFCKHCGMFGPSSIPPTDHCFKCGNLTWGSRDNQGQRWCEECRPGMPDERKTKIQLQCEEDLREFDRLEKEDPDWFEKGMKALVEDLKNRGADGS